MSFYTLNIIETNPTGEQRYRCAVCGEESGWLKPGQVGHSCTGQAANYTPMTARIMQRRAERNAAGAQPQQRCLESLVSDANMLLRLALRKEGITAQFSALIQRQLDASPTVAEVAEEVKRRAAKGLPA